MMMPSHFLKQPKLQLHVGFCQHSRNVLFPFTTEVFVTATCGWLQEKQQSFCQAYSKRQQVTLESLQRFVQLVNNERLSINNDHKIKVIQLSTCASFLTLPYFCYNSHVSLLKKYQLLNDILQVNQECHANGRPKGKVHYH